MTILELQYFTAIVSTGSFSKTADLFFTTQSSVSKKIAALEDEISVKLFDRTSGGVSLTPAGEIFLVHANNIIEEHRKMMGSIGSYLQRQGNQVKVGMHCLASHYNTWPTLSKFQSTHPAIEVNALNLSTWDIYESLKSGKCNIGILYSENVDSTKYSSIPLMKDRLVLAVPVGHKFADRASVSLQELRNEPMLVTSNRTQIFDIVRNACSEAGFAPSVYETQTFPEPILSNLRSNNCCLLFLEKALRYYTLTGLRVIPLQENIEATLVAIWPQQKKLSEGERSLIQYLKKSF